MIAPGDRVAAAVSGGADSVALLRILEKARGELGITLTVVHFDHRLRGEESDRDAQFVAELARSHGLEFFPDSANVAGEAERNGWNLEDAARRLRYGFFQRVIEGGHATRVAVAHTADDQAETVLAHVIRGTGPTGIGGIYPIVGRIVRPLLGIRRNELREYLIALKQPWREDATNYDQKRLRSRIRGQLLPGIERDFSPRIVEHLCELAQLSREEGVFWDALVEDRFRALASAKRAGDEAEEQVVSARDLLHPVGQSAGVARDGNGADSRSMEPWRALTERLIRRLYQDVRGTDVAPHRAGYSTGGQVDEWAKCAAAGRGTGGAKVRRSGFFIRNDGRNGGGHEGNQFAQERVSIFCDRRHYGHSDRLRAGNRRSLPAEND
jgi:tRNA(Ile)-lysidine synthetase-like protein